MLGANEVGSTEEALIYMTECTLATVAYMATKKSRAKGEYERQISIAQRGVDWVRQYAYLQQYRNLRIEDIITGGVTVGEWAKKLEEQHG